MKLTFEVNTLDKKDVEEAVGILVGIFNKLVNQSRDAATKVTDAGPETHQKSTKKSTEGVDSTKEKKELKTPATEKTEGGAITLSVLKERAKEKAKAVGREKVKETINEFAPMLSEVKEEDYGKLYKKLGELR